MASKRKRSLTGLRTTGMPHVGNYLGTIKPALELQEDFDCLYFLADLHALTTCKDPTQLKRDVYEVVAAWIACGFDYKKHTLYRQSDLPLVTELAWYLSCVTGMGFLEKGHSYKDALANNREVNHGTFAYPVLMAADILICDVDLVPVGKDQKQHVEMARDMAGSFNAIYGEVFRIPEVSIREDVMLIPGLDGRKMSKSYDNTIPLFCSEKDLRKLIMSLKTDSTHLEEPKSLKDTLLGCLFKLFTSDPQYNDLEQRLNKGGLGWGHAKEELFQAVNEEVKELRKQYNEIISDHQLLDQILKEGVRKAHDVALPVLNRVRHAVGLKKHKPSLN